MMWYHSYRRKREWVFFPELNVTCWLAVANAFVCSRSSCRWSCWIVVWGSCGIWVLAALPSSTRWRLSQQRAVLRRLTSGTASSPRGSSLMLLIHLYSLRYVSTKKIK